MTGATRAPTGVIQSGMTRPVLLDTDIAGDVDDALALALLAGSPELDLLGVTVVGCDNPNRAKAALSILELAGATGVEVSLGSEDPVLRRRRTMPVEVDHYPPASATPSTEPAAERIVRTAQATDHLELLAIGPLTNLANALALDRDLPQNVKRLTIMGGHLGEVRIGDVVVAPGVDYNLVHDPEATMAVLGAGFNLRLVPVEITLQTWLRPDDVAAWKDQGLPLTALLADLVDRWTPIQTAIFTHIGAPPTPDNSAFLHDPLTVLSLVDESALTFETKRVLPTIERGLLRTHLSPNDELGIVAEVAVAVDAGLARDQILSRLHS